MQSAALVLERDVDPLQRFRKSFRQNEAPAATVTPIHAIQATCASMNGAMPQGQDARGLRNCMVTTTDILYFRESPGGVLIIADWIPRSWLPENVTLTALARTSDWFKVDYYGVQGWISADYVSPQGACG